MPNVTATLTQAEYDALDENTGDIDAHATSVLKSAARNVIEQNKRDTWYAADADDQDTFVAAQKAKSEG